MAQMTLRGWLNVAVLTLILTSGLSLYVDVKDHDLHARHLEIKYRLEDILRLKKELSSMLVMAVLERNILRTTNYEKVSARLDATLRSMNDLNGNLQISSEISALGGDQEKLRITETGAIELMHSDKWREARLALSDDAYVRNTGIYEINTKTAVGAMAGEVASKAELFDQLRAMALMLRLSALALLLWVGAKYSRQLREELAQQKKSQAALNASQEALRNLASHEQAEREAGRKRVAQEIHDELGQRLTVLRMDVAMLPRAIAADPAGQLPARVTGLKTSIDAILAIVRDIAGKLRPAALEVGLAPAAEGLLQEFRGTLGIPCVLDNRLPGNFVIDDVRATGVFRILQESLTNVARHAHARHIQVTLTVHDEQLQLRVQDDGQGFADVPNGSFGLSGMRERAASLGGSLQISSTVGAGTTVEALIPLRIALPSAILIAPEDKDRTTP